jgi:hypothetical protein
MERDAPEREGPEREEAIIGEVPGVAGEGVSTAVGSA